MSTDEECDFAFQFWELAPYYKIYDFMFLAFFFINCVIHVLYRCQADNFVQFFLGIFTATSWLSAVRPFSDIPGLESEIRHCHLAVMTTRLWMRYFLRAISIFSAMISFERWVSQSVCSWTVVFFSSVSETDFEYIFLSHHEHWRRVWLRLSILRAMLFIIKSMILCFWHSSLSTVWQIYIYVYI